MEMVLLTALGVGGATVLGAVIGFLFKGFSHKFSDIVLSFAAGVMLAAAVLGLILPSVEYGGKFGLLICYDGDFPEMFRAYAKLGCDGVLWMNNRCSRGPDDGPMAAARANSLVIAATCCCGVDEIGQECPGLSHILGADGSLRTMDRGVLEILGQWHALNSEALHDPAPSGIEIEDKPQSFILRDGSNYYLFLFDLGKKRNDDVIVSSDTATDTTFPLPGTVKSVTWLDTGEPIPFLQEGGMVTIPATPQHYGHSFVARVAKITL